MRNKKTFSVYEQKSQSFDEMMISRKRGKKNKLMSGPAAPEVLIGAKIKIITIM